MLNTRRQGCSFHLENGEMLISSESVTTEVLMMRFLLWFEADLMMCTLDFD